jgi:ABC-type dipeptide/oligopeptide/nickel transport system ATPase subunit
VDLEISSGQSPLGLIGPSGVGKTTLIRVLHGSQQASAGEVTFNGRSVRRLRGAAKKEFAASVRFVSQDSLTIADPRETPKGRLDAAAKIARKGGRTHAVSSEEMLAAVGLGPQFLTRSSGTLSGGEKQRVALASALATRPEILVLDEPLTAVDPGQRSEIAGRLRGIIEQLGTGVLVASHDLELVQRLCPEVAFLADGVIVARGPLNDVLANPAHEEVRDLAINAPRAVQRFH